MSLDVSVLLEAVVPQEGAPDPRDSDLFTFLNQEIDKLSSLSASSQPDWAMIEQSGCEFLSTQSKDFLVASWLAEAWTQRHAMLGMVAGFSLMAGLIEKFWDTALPPVHRLRGRRNAILWWFDRLLPWLEQNSEITLGKELADRMLSAVRQIDAQLAEKDPEAPSLSRLLGLLQRIPVDAPIETATAPASVQAPAAPSTTAPPPAAEHPSAAAPMSHAAQQPLLQAESVSTAAPPGPQASVSAPPLARIPANTGPVEIRSNDDLIAWLKPVQDQVAQIGPALLQFDHAHPLAIYLSRFAARVSLMEMPRANQGLSVIAPPPVAILDAFEKVTGSKNPQAMVEFCEARIRAFPFWLDLDFHSARGYAMMGAAGAKMREAIVEALLNFLKRMPGIESYRFANDMPFASAETLAWIQQCQQAGQAALPNDALGQAQSQAQSQQVEGNTEAATTALQTFINSSRSGRDRFRARLALLDVLLADSARIDLQPLIDPITEECIRLDLNHWEPELASQVWTKKYQVARQVWLSKDVDLTANRREEARRQMETALMQLSVVDFAAAARLMT